METAIRAFVAVNFLVIGLSHIGQHRAWAEFFVRLHALGRPGAFANGFLHLLAGSLIVSFHNVWSGPAVLLTILGWLYVAKSLVLFLRPDLGLRSMQQVRPETSKKLSIAGYGLVVLGLILAGTVVLEP